MRKHFTAFDMATGEIRYTGVTRSVEDQVDLEEGIGAIEGHSDPRTQRVVDGKVRMIPKRQRDAANLKRAVRKMRSGRDRRLLDIDKTVAGLRWQGMTSEQQQEWVDYRQALLDLPETVKDVTNVEWPKPPS